MDARLANRRKTAEEESINKWMTETGQFAAANKGTDYNSPQYRQQMEQTFQDNTARIQQINLTFKNEFNANILADAVAARNQLLSKLGPNSEPKFGNLSTGGLYVFQGIIAGPQPVADAANYLEEFARNFRRS